ncbi:hypothetical protein [Streptomyces fagopyri]|uniref:hypothetical protein n=1 Tax=Streptomyces fagopyri TaxID=2662397 RepID=UPI0037210BB3
MGIDFGRGFCVDFGRGITITIAIAIAIGRDFGLEGAELSPHPDGRPIARLRGAGTPTRNMRGSVSGTAGPTLIPVRQAGVGKGDRR